MRTKARETGDRKIARQFSRESISVVRFADFRLEFDARFPAMNRWAIFARPLRGLNCRSSIPDIASTLPANFGCGY